MIFQLIDDKVNTCTIYIGDKNNTDRSNDEYALKSGVGCNTTVTFISDYNKQDEITVMDEDGSIVPERSPVQIALGHELVHALRAMKGNRKPSNLRGTNVMNGGDNKRWRQEEYDTVGIDHNRDDGSYANASEWHFTENSLRRELGFNIRVRYFK